MKSIIESFGQDRARWIIDVCEPHDILNFTISYCHVTSIIHNDIILFDHMSYDSFEIFKAKKIICGREKMLKGANGSTEQNE